MPNVAKIGITYLFDLNHHILEKVPGHTHNVDVTIIPNGICFVISTFSAPQNPH